MRQEKRNNKIFLWWLILSSIFFLAVFALIFLGFMREPKFVKTNPPDMGQYDQLGKSIYRYLPGWKVPYQWEYDNKLIENKTMGVTLLRGETKEVIVKFKNTGQKTWYRDIYNGDLNNMVYLITDLPASHPSVWGKADSGDWNHWKNIIYMDQEKVAPNEIGSFHFQIAINQKTASGYYQEHFRMARGDFSVFGEYFHNFNIWVPPIYRQLLLTFRGNNFFWYGSWLFLIATTLYILGDLCLNRKSQNLLLFLRWLMVFSILIALLIYFLSFFYYLNYPGFIADIQVLAFFALIFAFFFLLLQYLIFLFYENRHSSRPLR